jgi:hypothetical protein
MELSTINYYSSSRYYAVHLEGRLPAVPTSTQNFMDFIAAKTAVIIAFLIWMRHTGGRVLINKFLARPGLQLNPPLQSVSHLDAAHWGAGFD